MHRHPTKFWLNCSGTDAYVSAFQHKVDQTYPLPVLQFQKLNESTSPPKAAESPALNCCDHL